MTRDLKLADSVLDNIKCLRLREVCYTEYLPFMMSGTNFIDIIRDDTYYRIFLRFSSRISVKPQTSSGMAWAVALVSSLTSMKTFNFLSKKLLGTMN